MKATAILVLLIASPCLAQKKEPPKKDPPRYETVRELDKRGKDAIEKLKKRELDSAVKGLIVLVDKANPEHADSIRIRYQAIALISEILKIQLDRIPEQRDIDRADLRKEIKTWDDINARTFAKYDLNKAYKDSLQLGERGKAVTDLVKSIQEQWFLEDKKK